MGTTLQLHYFFFFIAVICVAGQEVKGDECVECKQGFYRSGEDRFSSCKSCEDEEPGYTTLGIGATDVANCSLCKAFYCLCYQVK